MAKKTINLIPQEGKQRLAFDMNVDVMIYGGGAGCLPANTEVLTSCGWKRIDQCDKDSVIAQYDITNDTLVYKRVQGYIKAPCERFYRLKSGSMVMNLSAEHKVLYKDDIYGDYKVTNCEDIVLNTNWYGYIPHGDGTCSRMHDLEISSFKPVDGYKYCFTTDTGYFLVRQNGRIFVTGNSGKSYLCLLKALKYAYSDPAFNGVIFRRNTTPVREGLFATAKRLYAPLNPRIREQAMEIDFTKTHGGHLKFTHLEMVSDAEKNHQGQEYTMVLFDELCQFEQEQFIYLLGRLRSESKTNAFCMATCNPDPDSFVLKWIEWYLDDEGFPDKNKIGVIRYFILKDNEPVFADTPEALINEYPEMCYIEDENGKQVLVPPQSFCFISASVFDNKELLRKEPRYISKLKGQTDVMRRRLLEGNWYARAEGANFFDRKWLKKLEDVPEDLRLVRAWDKAYAEPSEKNRYPDYTSSIMMGKDLDGNYYIIGDYVNDHHDPHSDIIGSFRKSIGIRNKWMLEQAFADDEFHHDKVTQIIPKEAAAGKGETELLVKMYEQNMIYVSVSDVTNIKNAKEKRFAPFSSAAQNGLVYIIEDTFNQATLQFFYNQLEKFDGTRSTAYKKDDLVDAVSDAYNYLQQDEVTRPVKLPNRKIKTLYNRFRHGAIIKGLTGQSIY